MEIDLFFIFQLICFIKATTVLSNSVVKQIHYAAAYKAFDFYNQEHRQPSVRRL